MNRKDRKTGPGSRRNEKVRGRNIRIRDDAVDKGTMGNRGRERAGDQEGQVEGRNPVLELLRSGRTVEKLLIARVPERVRFWKSSKGEGARNSGPGGG